MARTRAAFLHSPEIERYHYPPDCPFKTERAGMTRSILDGIGLLSGPDRSEVGFEAAPREVLERFHTARYLDAMQRAAAGELDVDAFGMGFGQAEVPVFREMVDYAALACGATLRGADLLTEKKAEVAFNPSGGYHHARPEMAAGFCYMNDVALACLVLADRLDRVLFLDIDVHHGDGVQDFFYDRADVMTMSFHESGDALFPGTGFEGEIGTGDGRGYSVNVPLPVGTYDAAYMRAFDTVAVPLIGAFNPDAIVFEVGADGLANDPLAFLALTNNAHERVARRVAAFGKPVLATGGGGYHPENTARAWALVWCALCGEESQDEMALGLGGVMLQSTDWHAGLRDRELPPGTMQRKIVDPAIDETIEKVRANAFAIHGL
ncbi:MAG: acetoin utilization protein AcuC [Planctomycetota bacterium]|nr:acetoin utilization protein AcuC [Planctomycetota bacterium]